VLVGKKENSVIENLFSYEGKRVVVTGASSGMGEATAQLIHSLGGEVIALDVQPPKYEFARYLEVDLRDSAAIEQAVDELTQSRVHNLFYCSTVLLFYCSTVLLCWFARWQVFRGGCGDGQFSQPATHD
jgi:NAD(P)-dependent dehydrogenase (short-subunit alcohol dehydrogenase family)